MSWYRLEKEPKDDAGGFFGDNTIDAGSCCRLANQLVHIAPPSAGWAPAPYLKNHLELGKAERQAISTFENGLIFDRPASVAALQGLGASSGKNAASNTDRLQLSIDQAHATVCNASQSVKFASRTVRFARSSIMLRKSQAAGGPCQVVL